VAQDTAVLHTDTSHTQQKASPSIIDSLDSSHNNQLSKKESTTGSHASSIESTKKLSGTLPNNSGSRSSSEVNLHSTIPQFTSNSGQSPSNESHQVYVLFIFVNFFYY
jgi:hypothetical protein